MYRRDYLTEVAPRRPGGLVEQRRPRRDHLTERLMRTDLHELADRSAPLPKDIPLEALLQHFSRVRLVQMWDQMEPGWDAQFRRG